MSDQSRALANVKRVVNTRGSVITLVSPDSNPEKNRYGNVISKGAATTFQIKAFPITPAPTQRELSRAGIKDDLDFLAYTATSDWDVAGYNIEQMRSFTTVKYQGKDMPIKIIVPFSHFGGPAGDKYLYVLIGFLNR